MKATQLRSVRHASNIIFVVSFDPIRPTLVLRLEEPKSREVKVTGHGEPPQPQAHILSPISPRSPLTSLCSSLKLPSSHDLRAPTFPDPRCLPHLHQVRKWPFHQLSPTQLLGQLLSGMQSPRPRRWEPGWASVDGDKHRKAWRCQCCQVAGTHSLSNGPSLLLPCCNPLPQGLSVSAPTRHLGCLFHLQLRAPLSGEAATGIRVEEV